MRIRATFGLTELTLAIMVAAALAVAAFYFNEERTSAADVERAESAQVVAQADAAQFDLDGLEIDYERVKVTPPDQPVPTRLEMERLVGEIALLVAAQDLSLGPIVQDEMTASVSNGDVGLDDDTLAARTYDAIELRLQLNGEVLALVDLIERLQETVPRIVVSDVQMARIAGGSDFSATLTLLLYHRGA